MILNIFEKITNWLVNQMPLEATAAKACRGMDPLLRARDTKVKAKFWTISRSAHSTHDPRLINCTRI
jgi:hypothetical protein